ncbi:MAG: GNA1162 family protein [Kiritimatiellia bacterium]
MKSITHTQQGRLQEVRRVSRTAVCGLCGGMALLLLPAGCVTKLPPPAHYHLQRTPVRVAVVPSANRTEYPQGSIDFDKALEEALRKKGFEVVTADQVLTYVSARGTTLRDLGQYKASEIGKDLRVDMLFYNELTRWGSHYVVIKSASVVAGSSRLVEASTDATVWRLNWQLSQSSGNGGGGLAGMIIDAAVSAVVDSAIDKCRMLGEQSARLSAESLPQPGFAPKLLPP